MFYHPGLDVRTLCRGDDFCVLGDDDAITEFEAMLAKKYSYKRLAILGFQPTANRRYS